MAVIVLTPGDVTKIKSSGISSQHTE